jgi:hypothetical protein
MIYFAHPINTYNTPLETKVLELIQKEFPNKTIFNPNHPYIEHLYKKKGIEVFRELVELCDSLICLPFKNGEIGAGMAKEINWAFEKNIPCYYIREISPSHPLRYERINTLFGYIILSIEQTREKLKK